MLFGVLYPDSRIGCRQKVLFYFSNDSAGACGDSPGLLFGKFAVHFPGAGDFAGRTFIPPVPNISRTERTAPWLCRARMLKGQGVVQAAMTSARLPLPGLRKAESRFAHENRNEPLEEHLQPR